MRDYARYFHLDLFPNFNFPRIAHKDRIVISVYFILNK